MAILLSCKVCGGKVSSDARQCPHCGSPNFIPDSFRYEQQEAQRKKRLAELRDMERIQGPRVIIRIKDLDRTKRDASAQNTSITLDGKPILAYTDKSWPYDSDASDPYRYRITLGEHTVVLKDWDKVTTKTFYMSANTHIIEIQYKSSFWANKYELVAVDVR